MLAGCGGCSTGSTRTAPNPRTSSNSAHPVRPSGWCAGRGAEPVRPHRGAPRRIRRMLGPPRLARPCRQTLFARREQAPPVANRTHTAPGVPGACRAAEVRLPKQRRKPVTRLASHRRACPVTHGVASKSCGSAPSLEGNTCVYDAPTTPRTRRCDEAGRHVSSTRERPDFPCRDDRCHGSSAGAEPLFSIWRRS